jgi:hypothetical protein
MTRWLRDLWDRLTRRRPRMVVGVVCHLLRPEDIAALREVGVRHVRLSLYGDDYGSQWIDAALDRVLAVRQRTRRLGRHAAHPGALLPRDADGQPA